MLTDQCFPPVLPANGEDDCLAIVQIENGSLTELVGAFLDLVTGYDLPVGSVVVLSSSIMLLRVGTAAYAEELVCAFTRVRRPTLDPSVQCTDFPFHCRGCTARY